MFHLLDIETGQDGGDGAEDGLFCDIVVSFTSSSFCKSNTTQLKQTWPQYEAISVRINCAVHFGCMKFRTGTWPLAYATFLLKFISFYK